MRSILFALVLFGSEFAPTRATALDATTFAYDSQAPLDIRTGNVVQRNGVLTQDISFASKTHRVTGAIVMGRGNAPHPGVLFVHWLGAPATTNHTEFERDATTLARRGVTSLLIDAMWSQPDWFSKGRSTNTDYTNSIAQVVDLRRSLDVLLSRPNVDRNRIAYVGHDFGAMYGAILAGVDPRPSWYILMTGTTTLSDWYLLGTKPANVQAYVAQMAPLDPLAFLSESKARAFYFQFSAHDRYITRERELEFFGAAPFPRTMSMYDVDHSLATPPAFDDRISWLTAKLGL